MARQFEIYVDLPAASVICDLYTAGTGTKTHDDLVCVAIGGKPGFFLSPDIAPGSYDIILAGGLGVDSVVIGTAQGVYQCGTSSATVKEILLPYFQSISRKDVTPPADLGGEYDPLQHSLEASVSSIIEAISEPQSANKIIVDENYGGTGALSYRLNSIPVADATIEVFLFTDYVLNRNTAGYRVAASRQNADGSWKMDVYLDPQIYAVRFFKIGVSGPDVYRVVVTFNAPDISIQHQPQYSV